MKITKIKKRLDREKIIILVNGWLSFPSFYLLLRKNIPDKYGFIQYAYSNDILCSNPEKTRNNFLKLIKIIESDLKKLNNKKPRQYYFYGQSLGGLFCMIISDKIKTENIMLIVPGTNLAEAFWFGEITQKLKKEMIKKYKTTLPELKKSWKDISPDHYFKNKSLQTKFNIILSNNDNIIPILNGKKLLKILKDKKIKHKVSWVNTPHILEVIKESLIIDNFIKWINSH